MGREAELGIGTHAAAADPRRVLVVGGGPAGMEAAITAAQRGHDVVLAEAGERLGGQVRLGASVAARAELADIVDFQARQLELLGVDVRMATRLDEGGIDTVGAAVVVVATGSTPRRSDLDSDGSVEVITPQEAVSRIDVGVRSAVVVIDDVGHFPAYVPAESMRSLGAEVTIVSSRFVPGWALDPTTARTMVRRLADAGVRFVLHHEWTRIADGALWVRDSLSGEEKALPSSLIVAAISNDRAVGRHGGGQDR